MKTKGILERLLGHLAINRPQVNPDVKRGQLINREAAIGGQLFGPLAAGQRRDFFCLDQHTWVWHEGQTDASGKQAIITTRYELKDGKIIKIQSGQPHVLVGLSEARNLASAIRAYTRLVGREIYGKSL